MPGIRVRGFVTADVATVTFVVAVPIVGDVPADQAAISATVERDGALAAATRSPTS
jgi:hypothetical protein